MKILYHHRTSSSDGQAIHIGGLTRALTALGHDLTIAAPATVPTSGLGEGNPLVAGLKRRLPGWGYEALEFGYNAVALLRLLRLHRRTRPDVLYERYNLFLLAGVWLARLRGTPLVLEVNAPLFEERARHGGLALRRLAAWSERTAWRAADVVLPVTAALADHVRAAGVPADRIVVIPNGVGPELLARGADLEGDTIRARRWLSLADGVVTLGFTGFLRSWHGLDRVLPLVTPGRHLVVVGDGPARADLEARARRLGVADRVTFMGAVAPEGIAKVIPAFDIALQPGVVPYASPLKIFEYMALARAIVAPDTPNIREILRDGESALLFDPASPDGLNQAVSRLCDDPVLRARLAAGARADLIRRGFTWENNARRVVALADRLVRRRRSDGLVPDGDSLPLG